MQAHLIIVSFNTCHKEKTKVQQDDVSCPEAHSQ